MGEAIDREGRVLDRAFGETKQEVFEKLIERNPDAHEIRIRSAEARAAQARSETTRSLMQTPSVGRVVHYVAYGTPGGEFPAGVCRAAIITEVDDPDSAAPSGAVGLMVANPTGQFFNRHVPYAADNQPGTWHWPERV